MPATYEPIATQTVSGAANFTFSTIPSTYTDLRIIVTGTISSANNQLQMRINSDSSALYSWTTLRGNGTTASSFNVANMTEMYVTDTLVGVSTTEPTLSINDIFSYTASRNKTILSVTSNDRNTQGAVGRNVWMYRSTTAVSSLYFFTNTGTWTGTVSLYGIKAA